MRARSSKAWKQLRPSFCLFWKELLSGSCLQSSLALSFRPSTVDHLYLRRHQTLDPQDFLPISATESIYLVPLYFTHTLFTLNTASHKAEEEPGKSRFCIALKTCLSRGRYSTCYHSLGIVYHWTTNHILFLLSIDSPRAQTNSRLANYEPFERCLSSCSAKIHRTLINCAYLTWLN